MSPRTVHHTAYLRHSMHLFRASKLSLGLADKMCYVRLGIPGMQTGCAAAWRRTAAMCAYCQSGCLRTRLHSTEPGSILV